MIDGTDKLNRKLHIDRQTERNEHVKPMFGFRTRSHNYCMFVKMTQTTNYIAVGIVLKNAIHLHNTSPEY